MAQMSIVVKTLDKPDEHFDVQASDTVGNLKDKIQERLGHPPNMQNLVLGKAKVTGGKYGYITLGELLGSETTLLLSVTVCAKDLKDAPFIQEFQMDAATPEDLASHYPHIMAQDPSTLKVQNSMLIKEGRAGFTYEMLQSSELNDQIYGSQSGLTSITYKIGITCNRAQIEVTSNRAIGLGCTVRPVDADLESRTVHVGGNLFAFHPGMDEGLFRIEGDGGTSNIDIGFTPPAYEDGKGGTIFEIELNKTGEHKVTLTSPVDPVLSGQTRNVQVNADKSVSYTLEWTNPKLWVGDASPTFSIHGGDTDSSPDGRIYYDHFSVLGK